MTTLSSQRQSPVLVVGPDRESLELLQLMLDMLGYPVLLARGVALADNLLRDHRPWLIVLDMSQPAPEVERFRLDQLTAPEVSEIPAVVVSPRYIGPIVADRLRAAALIESPVELSEVTSVIRHLASQYVR